MIENNNCLAGLKCPACASLEPFVISVQTSVLMYDDGDDPTGKHSADIEWEDDSFIECYACKKQGVVSDFNERCS